MMLYSVIVYYFYHMELIRVVDYNRADYLLNSFFQYNKVLDKNGDYDDPDDVESIFERLKKLNF